MAMTKYFVTVFTFCKFSPVWVNMWAFKVWARPNSLLQSPHFPVLFHCGSACASSDFLPHRVICCIQHKCATCLQCVFSDVSSNVQLDWMICHIVQICAISLQFELANVSSDVQLDWKICCIVHICTTLLQRVSSDVSSNYQLEWMICCIVDICADLLRCG